MRLVVNDAKIDLMRFGDFQNFSGGLSSRFNCRRVKETLVLTTLKPSFSKPAASNSRQQMNPLRNFLQPFRPVITGIQRRHVREQRLRGADVARGFLAADVLLARAEREAQARVCRVNLWTRRRCGRASGV